MRERNVLSLVAGLAGDQRVAVDRDITLRNNSNTLVPDGFGFDDAKSVMYATAVSKSRTPGPNAIAGYMEADKSAALERNKTLRIEKAEDIRMASFQAMVGRYRKTPAPANAKKDGENGRM